MKIDRLLGIVTYLLSHETASARILAERFEVSPRTIQRDIDAIAQAGIPIASSAGVNGGYYIEPRFRLDRQVLKPEDINLIITALKGMESSLENRKIRTILEQYSALSSPTQSESIFLDYSVAREGIYVREHLPLLQQAIHEKRLISFTYTNMQHVTTDKRVQPLALQYKWYAWYLYAYDTAKKDYRTYKLLRIRNPVLLEEYGTDHGDAADLIARQDEAYMERCERIPVLCDGAYRDVVEEYFACEKLEQLPDGNCLLTLCVPPEERLWQALLLSLGGKVKVLHPAYQEQLKQTAQEFLQANKNTDTLLS